MKLKALIAIGRKLDTGALEVIAVSSNADAVVAAYKAADPAKYDEAYLVKEPEVIDKRAVRVAPVQAASPVEPVEPVEPVAPRSLENRSLRGNRLGAPASPIRTL